jgi:hypothetical protein
MNLRTIIVAATLALPLSAAPAAAQFLTFVSAAGNDANTCFVQAAPCKTLQRGINQISAGGELRLLSSLAGNGFINKSITIEGGYNTVIGTIAVNSASAIVRFRRLNLNGRHAFPTGFNLINAAAVHIENSSAERYTQIGILLGANVSTELAVSNSVSRDNVLIGLKVSGPSTAVLTVEDSSFENNGDRGILFEDGRASVSRTTLWGNDSGFRILSGSATLFKTIAAGASVGVGGNGNGFSEGGGELTLTRCDGVGNSNEGLLSTAGTVRISDCTFTGNGTGVDVFGVTALTLENNLIAGNTTNLSGTLTPLTPE